MKRQKDKILSDKIKKSREISEKALKIAMNNTSMGKEKEAKEIINMVSCYLKDSKHFEQKGDLINSLGAIYYAHGWLDTGARLKIFNVSDDGLFTI